MFKSPKLNFTQVPNNLFDDWLPKLKEGELRLLLVVMRQTFGWGNKDWDRISITQLMQKTGMQRKAVLGATKSLCEKGLIRKHKEGARGSEQTWYSLEFENEKPIEDSNNFNQAPKDTPPSILRIPTKETLTKDISPIVPKGESGSSSKRVRLKEEKEEVAPSVFLTMNQQKDIFRRLQESNITPAMCYDKLSQWKIKKGIAGGSDYSSILKWVITAVKTDLSRPQPVDMASDNQKLAESIKNAYPDEKDIIHGYNYIEFSFGMLHVHIKFNEHGFRDRVEAALIKMGLPMV